MPYFVTGGAYSDTTFSDLVQGDPIEGPFEHYADAYLAVTAYKLNDPQPYIYKTTDYGKRWDRIDAGLPENAFVRVVREDPLRKGQLYAGTEAGMFVSFNDGGDWQLSPAVAAAAAAARGETARGASRG